MRRRFRGGGDDAPDFGLYGSLCNREFSQGVMFLENQGNFWFLLALCGGRLEDGVGSCSASLERK
jgi:hypothetical protein